MKSLENAKLKVQKGCQLVMMRGRSNRDHRVQMSIDQAYCHGGDPFEIVEMPGR